MLSETDFGFEADVKNKKYSANYTDKWDDSIGNISSTPVLGQTLQGSIGGIPYVGLLVIAVVGIYLIK